MYYWQIVYVNAVGSGPLDALPIIPGLYYW